jgi:hypothetical protein
VSARPHLGDSDSALMAVHGRFWLWEMAYVIPNRPTTALFS